MVIECKHYPVSVHTATGIFQRKYEQRTKSSDETYMFRHVSISILIHELEQPLCSGFLPHELLIAESAIQILVLVLEHATNFITEISYSPAQIINYFFDKSRHARAIKIMFPDCLSHELPQTAEEEGGNA